MDSCCKSGVASTENETSVASQVRVHIHGHVTVAVTEADTVESIKTKALNQLSTKDLNFTIDVEAADKEIKNQEDK